MPIVIDRHDGEEAGCRQLLALHGLRRSLERLAASDATARGARMALTITRLVRELRELIAALDRRVPQVERAAEASIARDAAALKVEALRRIAELEGRDPLVDRLPASARKRTTAR
jgi:hypothetical protein